MKLTLDVNRRSFTGRDGDDVEYISFTTRIFDETFTFVPKPEDKRLLLNYLRQMEEKESKQSKPV